MEELSNSEKLLVEALRDYSENFVSSGYSTMGFLLLMVGWLITSEKARDFILLHRSVSFLATILIVIALLGYIWGSVIIHKTSQNIVNVLEASSVPEDIYIHFKLRWRSVILFSLMQALPTILICWILSVLRRQDTRGSK